MGREVKRVPLDFSWPINRVWPGFLMPEELQPGPCRDCDQTGYSPEARAVSETFYAHQIGGPNAGRLAWHDKLGQAEVDHLITEGRCRVWRDGGWSSERRTAAEVNAEQRRGGLSGHDAINRSILINFRCERLGIERHCLVCGGEGYLFRDDAQRAAYDAWMASEPPAGEGWQMWENTSEGSPISPVFATPEQLARWLVDTGASALGGETASYKAWLRVARGGYAPSAVMTGGTLTSGVEGMRNG